MSLDLDKVARQIQGMADSLFRSSEERKKRCREALSLLYAGAEKFDSLKDKVGRSKTTWLVPELYERFDRRFPAPSLPNDFTVIGSDGSHIDVDRHRQARCFLINIGMVTLTYGEHPDAVLENFPYLYYGDENTYLFPPKGASGREQPIEGQLLGIKRSVHELESLAETAHRLPSDVPALGLIDGTLLLWGLGGKDLPSFVTEALLDNGFLKHLDSIKKENESKSLAVAAYISFPRSADVVNVLKVALCPHETPDCDRYCRDAAFGKRDCDAVSSVRDRDLFCDLLKQGERSALFISGSSVNDRYREHRVYFFYLNADDEIARIEIPEWVALNDNLLNLTHSIVLDQCRRGQGYPVALSEAHEQAVVGMNDRENFWHLTESYLEAESFTVSSSGKNMSKRTRWI